MAGPVFSPCRQCLCEPSIDPAGGSPEARERPPQEARRGIDAGAKKKRRAAGMKRHRPLRLVQQDESLLPRIQALKAEHPFWGSRHIWAYLRFVAQLPIKKKRLWCRMRERQLL